ncbi:hypothetical protein KP509_37G001100 [Ceratopteris richardii]|uniref:CASP-like protein n=1 Tax=Ceratopteris richardii TaxID=49495 RepID=A0A8T2Q6U0_CERRI|nr:hypothetical protein KP509_37G001100 [Ceratopteris richardii]
MAGHRRRKNGEASGSNIERIEQGHHRVAQPDINPSIQPYYSAPFVSTPPIPAPGERGAVTATIPIQPDGMQEKEKTMAALCAAILLRIITIVLLFLHIPVILTSSQSINDLKISYSDYPPFRYSIATAGLGLLFCIYDIVSLICRIWLDQSTSLGKNLLYLTYIGDQITMVVVLSGGSAAAATLTLFHKIDMCDWLEGGSPPSPPGGYDTGLELSPQSPCTVDSYDTLYRRLSAGTGVLFSSFVVLLASFVISSYSLHASQSAASLKHR